MRSRLKRKEENKQGIKGCRDPFSQGFSQRGSVPAILGTVFRKYQPLRFAAQINTCVSLASLLWSLDVNSRLPHHSVPQPRILCGSITVLMEDINAKIQY